MTSVDRSSLPATGTDRKAWSTPVVIVESASRETLSNFNARGADGITSSSSVGS